ncbi:MAG: LON peptidase substrate-binding domain-containing protein [Deltaproteobacteria bacterium]|nr:LON peptidase substrate-binding domain-containing protein [Deltaproteobacteria bacterium]
MPHPTGLLMTAATVTPEAVSRALNEQGGPEWDETVFQMLTGIDLRGLAQGKPAAGVGTAIAFASSGWWVRCVDELADRLAAEAGEPVLAVFEAPDARAAGYHLARPGGTSDRSVAIAAPRKPLDLWSQGVTKLLGGDSVSGAPPLADIAQIVHHNDPSGTNLPGMFNFSLASGDSQERSVLGEVHGTSLVGGYEWKPGARRDPAEQLPKTMRVITLSGPPRLPGPPRWAKADRSDSIRIAQEVMEDDGWVCLVPKVGEVLGIYGSAVQLSQLAPLPRDGRWAGVLHPREAVRIGHFTEEGFAEVEPVAQTGVADGRAFDRALSLVLELLPKRAPEVVYDEATLRADDDPAGLLAWQLPVNSELSQSYLGSSDPTTRLEVLVAALNAVE